MLLILQLALGVAFLGYLILAFFDAIRGFAIILSGLALLAFGLTLKGIAFVLKKIHPAAVPAPTVAPTPRVIWRVVP